MGKPIVKVIVEDCIAVAGQLVVGIRLVGSSVDLGEQLIRRDLRIASEADIAHQRLRPLINLEPDGKMFLDSFVMVLDNALDLNLPEAVGLVEVLQSVDVAGKQ